MQCLVFLMVVLSGACTNALCPNQDGNFDFSKTFTQVLSEQGGSEINITEGVIMDQSPPDTYTIIIHSNGTLVWEPEPSTDITLKVYSITVYGQMHIGGVGCRYTRDTTITFYGEKGAVKGLFTYSGSIVEVHGADKPTWTKLSSTASKFEGYIVEQENQNTATGVKKGLVVFEIDSTTGELVGQANIYNFVGSQSNFASNVANFENRLNNAQNGNILAIGIRKTIVKALRNLTDVFVAIENVYGSTTVLRDVEDDSAYVMVVKKGDTSTGVEKLEISSGSDVEASISTIIGDLNVEILSDVYVSRTDNGKNKVKLWVADDEEYRPTVTVIDSDLGWVQGDRVVVASTDFDWEQAEEKTVLSVDGSSIRFEEHFEYEHYGEIYKNVDMRGEVILLTRNVKFTSVGASTDDGYNGQLKFHKNFDIVRIESAEFENLGQEDVMGSYPIHFHMCENVEDKIASIRQNSVHHSHNRCFTIHGTSGVELVDNGCYITIGHQYFFEDGAERDNVLDGNIGLLALPGNLIPTDETPAIYWVTNPDNILRNNVAAGGIGPAYWYAFPTSPMGPSADKNWMLADEARFTPITEFDNNVAHSFKQMSMFFFDNKIDPETGIASGYSNYDPREDPIRHVNHGDSPTKQVNITRITAYKGSPYCVWIRGGSIKVENASVADCLIGMTLLRDTDAEQFLENTVIIGDSPNKGEPTIFDGEENSLGRSFPLGRNENNRNTRRVGKEFMKGPCYLKNVWFDDFNPNGYYNMSALGFRTDNDRKSSPRNTIESLGFGFDDVSDGTEGNRVFDMAYGDPFYSEADGDKIATIKDFDCSLTDFDPCTKPTIIRPYPFYQTGNCLQRDNWNMMACNEVFAQVRVGNMTEDITIYRDDDYPNKWIEADAVEDAAFNVITRGDYSYSFQFDSHVPSSFKVRTLNITRSNYVRLGMCITPNANLNLTLRPGNTYNKISQWSTVSNPRDLDTYANNGDDGGKYFFNATLGYLAVVLRHTNDLSEDETSDCPDNDCVVLTVNIENYNGDTTNHCLEDTHNTYTLEPVQSRKRRSVSKLKRMLSRKRRSISSFTNDLPATSANPPVGYGAGSTKS